MQSIMTVRAPDALQEDLKKIAAREGLTRNALILQILWDWVKQKETNISSTGREVRKETISCDP